MRLPKNFQPVGTSKHSSLSFSATRSKAAPVGMERETPLSPSVGDSWHCQFEEVVDLLFAAFRFPRSKAHILERRPSPRERYGMQLALAARTATESEGVTKKPFLPRIMFRSCGKKKRERKSQKRFVLHPQPSPAPMRPALPHRRQMRRQSRICPSSWRPRGFWHTPSWGRGGRRQSRAEVRR